MKSIVTFTMNPAIDKNSAVDHVVAEKKLRCDRAVFEPGGGGVNVSRAIRKLGGDSLALYPSGGPTGEMLELLIEEEGLNHISIKIQDWTRENFIAFEKSTSLQYRFGLPGPGLYEEEWLRCLRILSELDPKPDYLVISGSLPQQVPDDFYAQAVRIVKDWNSKVILDVSQKPLALALKEGVYMIKPNLNELAELTGISVAEELQQQKAVMQIIESGRAEIVVVSLGAAGALSATREGLAYWRSPLVPIKSKVGAGDSMVAGLTLSLARGHGLEDSIRFGIACGAAAVMTPGSELCRREDAEQLFHQVQMTNA